MTGWQDRARALREEGLSIREIAAEVGKGHSVVGELFKPRTHAPCAGCGQPVGSNLATVCVACYRANAAANRKRIVEMWADGATWPEIGAALGWDRNRVSAEFGRIRRSTPELLPYRYGDERRRNMRTARWEMAA